MATTIKEGTEKTIDEMEEFTKNNGEVMFVDEDGRQKSDSIGEHTIKYMRPSVIKWTSKTYNDFHDFQRRRARQRMQNMCSATLALMVVTILVVAIATTLYVGWATDSIHLLYLLAILTAISPIATIMYVRRNYTINGDIID